MPDEEIKVDLLKKEIEAIKLLDFNESISSLYQKKLDFLVKLFDYGAQVFKKSQKVILGLDTRILNEYQYFSRAQNTLIRIAISKELDIDACFAIDDALSAARHILNDTIDILVLHASSQRQRLSDICETIHMDDVYSNGKELKQAINYFEDKIAHTRKIRGVLRIEEYIEMVESDHYKFLINFLNDISEIEFKIKKRKKAENIVGKRWTIGIIVIIIGWFCLPIVKSAVDKYTNDIVQEKK